MYSESFTLRLLGDGGQLKRELGEITDRIAGVESRFESLRSLAGSLDSQSYFSRLESQLARLPAAVNRLAGGLRSLSGITVRLNVTPAVRSLAMLGQLARQTGGQLRSLSGGFGGMGPAPMRYATGGLVRGPGGIDRVPALLTDGEYVLRREAVRRLGRPLLDDLNRHGSPTGSDRPPTSAPSPSPRETVNHFGGVTVSVRSQTDVDELLRTLTRNGIRERVRFG